jgi:hypothetical protein
VDFVLQKTRSRFFRFSVRLKLYLDQISLSIEAGGIGLDYGGLEAANDFEWARTA